MKGLDDSGDGGATKDGDPTWPAIDALQDNDSSQDLISPAQLIRYLDEAAGAVDGVDGDATSRLPRITSMPEPVRVEAHRVGRAVAQWVLHVRCDCGRRWFEVEPVDATNCPRCGMLVYVDVDARSARR